jgi:membrane associated rhomboid family serine protease
VHGDWDHLISNSFPFLILGTLIVHFYNRVAFRVFGIIYVATGCLVWSFASWNHPDSYHIGASGLVYGFAAFLFGCGMFRANKRSIALAFLVTFIYSGMVWGVLPLRDGVSWESHLFGALVGLCCAYYFRDVTEPGEEEPVPTSFQAEETHPFLPRDVFEKTLAQRAAEKAEAERAASYWFSSFSNEQ